MENKEEIKIKSFDPKVAGRVLSQFLYKYGSVNKFFSLGFVQIYNNFINPLTRIGRTYEEDTGTIGGAVFDYVLADCNKDKNIQAGLIGGLSRGKVTPFLQVSPTLCIFLNYGEKKLSPDSIFCKGFPFEKGELGAIISPEGDMSCPQIKSRMNDSRLENLTKEVVRKLEEHFGSYLDRGER